MLAGVYWNAQRGRQFTFVTEGFLYGKTMLGQNVDDLLRWENWLSESMRVTEIDAVGISYGGDLALAYPVFSRRVKKIFASGTLGSFSMIYSRSYNAPAHCIPGVLKWMDRSDIAGLNAPRPIIVHYGELCRWGPRLTRRSRHLRPGGGYYSAFPGIRRPVGPARDPRVG